MSQFSANPDVCLKEFDKFNKDIESYHNQSMYRRTETSLPDSYSLVAPNPQYSSKMSMFSKYSSSLKDVPKPMFLRTSSATRYDSAYKNQNLKKKFSNAVERFIDEKENNISEVVLEKKLKMFGTPKKKIKRNGSQEAILNKILYERANYVGKRRKTRPKTLKWTLIEDETAR